MSDRYSRSIWTPRFNCIVKGISGRKGGIQETANGWTRHPSQTVDYAHILQHALIINGARLWSVWHHASILLYSFSLMTWSNAESF